MKLIETNSNNFSSLETSQTICASSSTVLLLPFERFVLVSRKAGFGLDETRKAKRICQLVSFFFFFLLLLCSTLGHHGAALNKCHLLASGWTLPNSTLELNSQPGLKIDPEPALLIVCACAAYDGSRPRTSTKEEAKKGRKEQEQEQRGCDKCPLK